MQDSWAPRARDTDEARLQLDAVLEFPLVLNSTTDVCPTVSASRRALHEACQI